jgi:1-acyl-sn-glycerol-3-phosphate acyltransferase
LSQRGDRAVAQIRDLARSLAGGDALLLFPEGGNFTWARWQDAISRLRSSGRLREARRAWRQSHTLPPRTGGAAAAMAGAPHANVLVVSHTGFCADGRARPWWRLPVHRQLIVHVSLVPDNRLPDQEDLATWLQRTWSEVDAWVVSHTEHTEPQKPYL